MHTGPIGMNGGRMERIAVETLTLPALYSPFPATMNPAVEQLKDHALAWVRRFGLIRDAASWDRFVAAEYWVLIARAYPEADFEALAIAHDWNCWGFMLDDLDDEGPNAQRPEEMRGLF